MRERTGEREIHATELPGQGVVIRLHEQRTEAAGAATTRAQAASELASTSRKGWIVVAVIVAAATLFALLTRGRS